MISRTITFVDYNGVERTETFYFHFTKAEIVQMELGITGGLSEMVQKIIETKDFPSLVELWKDLIIKAYGVRSPDGRKFIKNDEVREDFLQTEAYSMLFMELATDAEKAADFFNGIIPDAN